MEFSSICRMCMSSGTLNLIFRSNKDHEAYSLAIYEATGVKVQYNDNLPQNMCTDCINRINDSQNFRQLSQETETKLLKLIVKEEVVDNISKKNTKKIKRLNSNSKRNTLKLKIGSENYDNDCDIKSEIDSDDDKPLKQLLSSPITNIKQYDTCPEEIFEDSNMKSDAEIDIELDLPKYSVGIGLIKTKNGIKNDVNDNSNSDQPIEPVRRRTKIDFHNSNLTLNNFNDPESINLTKQESLYEFVTDPVNEKSMKVLCKLCNKELALRSIDSHLNRRHPGVDERKVKCELCDTYVMKEKLNRHKLIMHGKECLKCGYCKTEFVSNEALVDHAIACNAKTKKRKRNEAGRELRECDICHQMMQKASLRMHKAVKHAGLRPVCEHCGKSFGNKFRLNEHYRAKHGYEKFLCSYCDFKSASIMAMRNHERRHRGEKPFSCDACEAKFHAAYLLAQHKQSHNTEKLNKCDQCPASFKSRNGVHMHKLNCHSSTPARCAICCRAYKSRLYAAKHARHVHRCEGPAVTIDIKNDVEIDNVEK